MNSSEKIAMYEATAAAIERGERLPPLPEMVREIESRFRSGNSIPVERTHITLSEFDAMIDQMREYAAMAVRMSHTWPVLKADAREKGEAVAFRWLRNGEPASRWMDGQPTERQFKAAKDCEDIAIWSVQYAYMLPATQPAQASESMDLPQELLDRVDVLRKKAEANEGVKSQASEKDNDSLRSVAKRNLRSLINIGSNDKALMLKCLEELS